MLGEFDQIRLPKRVALVVLAGTLIYGAVVIYFYCDAAHEEIVSIRVALSLIVVLLSYWIYQFITGGSMTVWVATFEYDDDDWNKACRWAVFIVSIATLTFLPGISPHCVS